MNYASQLAEEGTHISTLKETTVLNPPVFLFDPCLIIPRPRP